MALVLIIEIDDAFCSVRRPHFSFAGDLDSLSLYWGNLRVIFFVCLIPYLGWFRGIPGETSFFCFKVEWLRQSQLLIC